MRKAGFATGAIAVVAFAVLFGYPRLFTHKIELKMYSQNVNGLRAGAPVRLAGVEVGTIESVRVRPELQAARAEVRMMLRTTYPLEIPNDSTVSLETAGVLGETFAEINILGASGAPVKNGGILKEKPTKTLSTEELIEKIGDIVQHKPCASQGKDVATAAPDGRRRNQQ